MISKTLKEEGLRRTKIISDNLSERINEIKQQNKGFKKWLFLIFEHINILGRQQTISIK